MKTPFPAILLALATLSGGCGDEPVTTPAAPPAETNQTVAAEPLIPLPELPFALSPLMPSELDQAQESYDENKVTSFSVGEQGWQSYKASVTGYLTHFSFYGCAHTKNQVYGDSITGEIRLARTQETLGTWSITRDDIVAQLKARGLPETTYEWIKVRIPDDQRIPQVAGETYVIRCTQIGNGRQWFGSFRFATGDRYPEGAWWHALNASSRDADLVFRTYVGKTAKQVTAERAHRLAEAEKQLRGEQTSTADNPTPPVSHQPFIPPGESVPIAPPDPLPPVRQPPKENGGKKPLLPFLRPRN